MATYLDGGADLTLVLNGGSSSLKFGVYRHGANDEEPLLTGSADGIGSVNGSLNIFKSDGTLLIRNDNVHESQGEAFKTVAASIQKYFATAPVAIGHRVVHGGPMLCTHQLITGEVLGHLRDAVHFAPLHIPPALELIAAAHSIFPSALQFACFDDAFHQTMPEIASHLPLPRRYFEAGIRKYGFHGISYESLVHHFGAKLPDRAIFAHLGSGSSLCALLHGKSIDTTMGLTPTGGIPMGTRSGDLDPGVILYLLRNEQLDANRLEDLLNHRSGLFGLSSGESDVRALELRARAHDESACFTLDVFAVAVKKSIGAYIALLGGIDLLVFTGGIGEHSEHIRSAATQGMESLGLTADKIQVVVTEEEKQIARHCRNLFANAQRPAN